MLAFQDGPQDNAEAVSYLITKGNFSLLQAVRFVSGIPAPSQFNPFLQLGLLALHARSFLGHKLPLLSSYNLNFPFTGSNAFGSSSIKPLWAMLLQFLLLFGLLAILVLTFISRDSRKG